MTGGLQVQALETYRALVRLCGADSVELFNWSERRPLADIYHFLGFPPHVHRLAELVHEAGRAYFCTILFGNSRDNSRLWAAMIRHFLKLRVLRQPQSDQAIRNAAAVITITDADADAVRAIYRLSVDRVHVIVHGIDESFFDCSPKRWQTVFGSNPFVLSVGAIQSRKNQLLLVDACNRLGLPAVLLGPVLPGEKQYAARVAAVMETNKQLGGRWLQDLQSDDPLLISAFAACRCFVLLSTSETQPLSLLQAMAAQKPVLLLRASYTRDKLFCHLPTVKTPDPDAVASALHRVWTDGASTSLSRDFTWNSVARQLHALYQGRLGASTVE
jgi:glycosyltransferase involved in cell wall biosynthesis